MSFRNMHLGSWYIQEFSAELMKSLNSEDLLSILVNVNRHVALKYEAYGKKQMPIMENTMLRKIYFGDLNKSSELGREREVLMDWENENQGTLKKFTDHQNFIVNLFKNEFNDNNLEFLKYIERFLKDEAELNAKLKQLEDFYQTVQIYGDEKVEMKLKELILEFMKKNDLTFPKEVKVNQNEVSKYYLISDREPTNKVVNNKELSAKDQVYYDAVDTVLKNHPNLDDDLSSRLKLFQKILAASKSEDIKSSTKNRIANYYNDCMVEMYRRRTLEGESNLDVKKVANIKELPKE